MKKEKAGERKRTVTVTIGPKSWAMIQDYIDAALRGRHHVELTATTICASAVAQVLNRLRTPSVEPSSDDWLTLGE